MAYHCHSLLYWLVLGTSSATTWWLSLSLYLWSEKEAHIELVELILLKPWFMFVFRYVCGRIVFKHKFPVLIICVHIQRTTAPKAQRTPSLSFSVFSSEHWSNWHASIGVLIWIKVLRLSVRLSSLSWLDRFKYQHSISSALNLFGSLSFQFSISFSMPPNDALRQSSSAISATAINCDYQPRLSDYPQPLERKRAK